MRAQSGIYTKSYIWNFSKLNAPLGEYNLEEFLDIAGSVNP